MPFVVRSQLSDALLRSDYLVLEEAMRAAEAARRGKNQVVLPGQAGTAGFASVAKRKGKGALLREANKRGIRLRLMPDASSVRRENRSYFRNKSATLFWSAKWVCAGIETTQTQGGEGKAAQEVGEELGMTLSAETATMKEAIAPLLKTRPHLSLFAAYLRKTGVPANAPVSERRIEVGLDAAIGQVLIDQDIIEYPVFDVVLIDTIPSSTPSSSISTLPQPHGKAN